MSAEFDNSNSFPGFGMPQEACGHEELAKTLQHQEDMRVRINALHYAVNLAVGIDNKEAITTDQAGAMIVRWAEQFYTFLAKKGLPDLS